MVPAIVFEMDPTFRDPFGSFLGGTVLVVVAALL